MRRHSAAGGEARPAGQASALAVCGTAFFLGGLFGCLLALWSREAGSAALEACLRAFLAAAQAGEERLPSLPELLWSVLRWPGLVFLLGFTALGAAGVPLVLWARGFSLGFSIASCVRVFGRGGSLLAFTVFGVPGCVGVPVLFVLGVRSVLSARALAGGGVPLRTEGTARCLGACAGALFVCIMLEYLAVPAFSAGLAGLFAA